MNFQALAFAEVEIHTRRAGELPARSLPAALATLGRWASAGQARVCWFRGLGVYASSHCGRSGRDARKDLYNGLSVKSIPN